MTVMTTIETQWNVPVLLILLNVNLLYDILMVLTTINLFDDSGSFYLFDDIQKQSFPEAKQPRFQITKSKTFHYDAFA